MDEHTTERTGTARPPVGRRGRWAALAVAALALGGAGVAAAPGAAQAAPACAAGWESYEGWWHTADGWPAYVSATCDANGVADWTWSIPFGGLTHFRQNVFWGMPYLEHWDADGTSLTAMLTGDPNQLVLSDETGPGAYRNTTFFRGSPF